MADDGFNGSTLSLDGNPMGKIRSIRFSEAADPANVTSTASEEKTHTDTIPNHRVSAQMVGAEATDFGVGDSGVLAIVWFDGVTTDAGSGNYIIFSRETAGEMNGEILTDIEMTGTV